MFLYALNHLVGVEAWTMDELKGYGSAKTEGYTTLCHGHPEIHAPGVEVTTGPLGQGIANAVGLAIASKNLAARFNKSQFDIVQARIYCMTGDGCLMEGVALEALSLAGNLGLDNLVLIYDDNQVTCDGPLHWINTEDVNTKLRAAGWNVLDVPDGSYNVQTIVAALKYAGTLKGKPTMVHVRTVIGLGTRAAGTFRAHHGQIDHESVASLKKLAGQDSLLTHSVPHAQLAYFRERQARGQQLEKEWVDLVHRYERAHPDLGLQLNHRRRGDDRTAALQLLDELDSSQFAGLATRDVSGKVLHQLWDVLPVLFGGGADLVTSNKLSYADGDVFHPSVGFAGRYIRYGIREHAMASVSNGIAAYSCGTFLPITATFFMFYLYVRVLHSDPCCISADGELIKAAPGVRMGALSNLPVIHIATHDSFAEGQNGPTHQPVELDSLYRAMPNMDYIRPCDAEETIGAWLLALKNNRGPTLISLGRDPAGQVPGTDRFKVAKGAYVVREVPNAKLILVSCGTNLHHCIVAAETMSRSGVPTRVISAPSLKDFDKQPKEYRERIFPLDGSPIVSVEEYVATVWARYVTASIGMTGFGYSASNASNYDRFELDAKGIVKRLRTYLADVRGTDARASGWKQL